MDQHSSSSPAVSMLISGRPGRWLVTAIALLSVLALAIGFVPGAAAQDDGHDPADADGFDIADVEARLGDLDRRAGAVAPTSAQRAAAADLGADTVEWNKFGTPAWLFDRDGALGGASDGAAADVARAFVRDHADLFRLSGAQVDALEVLRDSPLHDPSDLARVRDGEAPANADVAHAVLFRQAFDGLPAAHDGLLTVGVAADGSIVSVASSLTPDERVTNASSLTAVDAVAAAAADVGLDLGDLSEVDTPDDDFTTFAASLLGDVQRARLRALPTPSDGVRRVWEVTLLDSAPDPMRGGNPLGVISHVDAETGEVLLRSNRVDHLQEAPTPSGTPFDGETGTNGECGVANGPFSVGAGQGRIDVVVQTTAPSGTDDDITVNLYYGAPIGAPVASQDLLTSPEVLSYEPATGVPPGDYFVEVCPFNSDNASPIGYAGIFSASAGSPVEAFSQPRWRVFPTNPNFVDSADPSADTRLLWCWISDAADCDEEQQNIASRVPWDFRNETGAATFTTDGNNASTAISEASFLTPDTVGNRPTSLTRTYDYDWDDNWRASSCDPTTFSPASTVGDTDVDNDEAASVTNLFVQHNRVHDWSYFKGFTENNSNAQYDNFGNTAPDRENDPELGSAQAGRRTFNGRDNANQITLQDGVPPITNQYLWQPLAGAFYGTCTDGAYDAAVVLHEYHHLVSNRMIAGPDTGTGDSQGQTESWSDLGFAAYFWEYGLRAAEDANPFALGPYVTGNKQTGIRNYGMNDSPLNYSGLQYDANGTTSPHAPGEIWSATNFDIATRLNATYDAEFPSTDRDLQEACARGERSPDTCPGNVRWAQIMYDAFLVQPAGASMVVSRDAMLAADVMRFDGANQSDLWAAFAGRGLGDLAFSDGVTDTMPSPGWTNPVRADNAVVTFRGSDVGDGLPDAIEFFVGDYEARISPTADTDASTSNTSSRRNFDQKEPFAPGTYTGIARADGFGATRFTFTVEPGRKLTVEVPMRANLASVHNGAVAQGDGERLDELIDDTEETNWESTTSAGTASEGNGEGAQVEGRQVTVDLAGGSQLVRDIAVSAALVPGGQSRFSALRSFDVFTCDAAAGDPCGIDRGYTKVFSSSDDAFDAGRPRPLAPDLTLRPFDIPDTQATHVRLVVRDNQCTGGPDYQGDQDNDPAFNSDCDTMETSPDRALLSPPTEEVRAAELQVFSTRVGKGGKGSGKAG